MNLVENLKEFESVIMEKYTFLNLCIVTFLMQEFDLFSFIQVVKMFSIKSKRQKWFRLKPS